MLLRDHVMRRHHRLCRITMNRPYRAEDLRRDRYPGRWPGLTETALQAETSGLFGVWFILVEPSPSGRTRLTSAGLEEIPLSQLACHSEHWRASIKVWPRLTAEVAGAEAKTAECCGVERTIRRLGGVSGNYFLIRVH